MVKIKEKNILDEQLKFQGISKEFEHYKQLFNSDNQEKLTMNLSLATDKIAELEATVRKINKSKNICYKDEINYFLFFS